jgi:sugar phosphate isomerase/epimerase
MSNRRDFLQKSLLGIAAVAVPGALASEARATELVNRNVFKPMPVSCLSYSFHGLVSEGMMDIFHYLETCRYRYNLDAADLWNGMITSTDDAFINKVYRALQERQLVVPNIACDGGHLISDASKDSPEDRARLRGIHDRYLEICKKWGVGFLRLDAGPMPGGQITNSIREDWNPADFDYLVKRYRELAQYAYDNGFKVGAENHMGHEKFWPNMEKLIKAVDHPGFGICVHFGGWTPNSPETAAKDNDFADRAAAKWICHTHIPWDVCEDEALLLEKMTILRDAGYQGYYNIEHHSGQNEYNLVDVQLSKVRAVLTSWNNNGTGQLNPPRQPRRRP